MHIRISLEDPAQPEIVELLQHGEAYGASLYPAESNHFLPIDALRGPNVLFAVARDEKGIAVGTGALVLNGDWAELKRMWVVPHARGQGISKAILVDLESRARQAGIRAIRLETGINNHESLSLYRRVGFQQCDPFADYGSDPLSVFMEKEVA